MIYFANPSNGRVGEAMMAGLLGAITTPAQGNKIGRYPVWCADNGCGPGVRGIGMGYPGDDAFLVWLESLLPFSDRCKFAVAPDVVGDAAATLDRSRPFLPLIRAMGYPAAFVAQNGQDRLPVPWDEFDVLFNGGDDGWKLGEPMRRLASEAKARGKWLHMGRVNSLKRMRRARADGYDSCDGRCISFGPDIRLPEALGWLRDVNDQGVLWGEAS